MKALHNYIGRRVFGPFNEKGRPGERESFRIDTAARAYRYKRLAQNIPAMKALALSLPLASRDSWPKQWFGQRATAGAAFTQSGESMRWIEDTESMGFRFLGFADEITHFIRHTGWHCDSYGDSSVRGGVWQLPGKNKQARLVFGYVEMEGGKETNPGSACIAMEIISLDMRGADYRVDLTDESGCHDCAYRADGIAESVAEDRRDYDSAYQRGREAAEKTQEAIEARRALLPLLIEYKAATRAGIGPSALPIDGPLASHGRREIDSLLETIEESRAARLDLWGNCATCDESAWLAGFQDELESAQYRAAMIALGLRARLTGEESDNG